MRWLDEQPMSRLQKIVITICILLTALDGFDVLAISFAAPGIADEWGISRAALGVVLAAELFGMAIGALALGSAADNFGRRPTILTCLFIMTVGMYASSLAASINFLLITRLITGVGIGGMLASTNAMVAEYANLKFRNLCVMLMAAGFPIGAIIGGSISTQLLLSFDWRVIFLFGAICTGIFFFVAWFLLPESIGYLLHRQPKSALRQVNKILNKIGADGLDSLPQKEARETVSYRVLFSKPYRLTTVLLVIGYFTHIMTFYYVLKWIPKLVVDMGYHPSAAGSVLVWANVGGALGAIAIGLVSTRVKLQPALIVALCLAALFVCVFGLEWQTSASLSWVAALAGFFTNAGVVGFYALIANAYPTQVRGSGTGVVIGVGRGGAALGPVVAGVLFVTGMNLLGVSIAMSVGSALAAICVLLLWRQASAHGN